MSSPLRGGKKVNERYLKFLFPFPSSPFSPFSPFLFLSDNRKTETETKHLENIGTLRSQQDFYYKREEGEFRAEENEICRGIVKRKGFKSMRTCLIIERFQKGFRRYERFREYMCRWPAVLVWAAITKHCELGGSYKMYFSELGKLEVQYEGV